MRGCLRAQGWESIPGSKTRRRRGEDVEGPQHNKIEAQAVLLH